MKDKPLYEVYDQTATKRLKIKNINKSSNVI